MKTVFDNRQCAHVWAQRSQPYGRSGSMKFEGDVLYSYQTPIAAFHDIVGVAMNIKVVLIASETFSVTTSSKHMPAARRAVTNFRTFTVPYIRANSAADHKANLAYLVAKFWKEADRLKRARDVWGSPYLQLEPIERDIRAYAQLFGGLEVPNDINSIFVDNTIAALRAELGAKNNTPAKIAAHARAAAKREAAEQAKREAIAAAQGDRLREWLAGASTWLTDLTLSVNGGAYLRIRGDLVQTSQGASVPVADAKRVIGHIRAVMHKPWGGPPHYPKGLGVGAFTVERVDMNGDIKAGCHFIEFSEIDRIGKLLGV
jgi:hypothetical protein